VSLPCGEKGDEVELHDERWNWQLLNLKKKSVVVDFGGAVYSSRPTLFLYHFSLLIFLDT
jgi:hypothetical protein